MVELRHRLILQPGETVFPPIQAPFPLRAVRVSFERDGWPDTGAIVLRWTIQASQTSADDDWQDLGGGETVGGKPGYTAQVVQLGAYVLPEGTFIRVIATAFTALSTRVVVTWQP